MVEKMYVMYFYLGCRLYSQICTYYFRSKSCMSYT
jgi:hypothetical protein